MAANSGASGLRAFLSLLLPFSKPRLVQRLVQRQPVLFQARQVSTQPNTGRLKLQQESDNDVKGHVAPYYYNRNPRSPELLGIAEKPRGFKTWHRRVDYYHRYVGI